MFESDQHEFDEEYEGYQHPAPPSPPVKPETPTPQATPSQQGTSAPQPTPTPQATPMPVAAPTRAAEPISSAPSAVHEPIAAPAAVHEPIVEEEPQEEEQEAFQDNEDGQDEYYGQTEEEPAPPPKRRKPNMVLFAGFGALVLFTIFVIYTARPKQNTAPPGDLGPGIVADAGLRGHLETRWDGDAKTGKLVYQLRVEPMEDRWQAGFSRVALNPPMPLSANIRLLDSTGFALCGKEIDFRFDPRTAGVPMAIPAPAGGNGKKMSPAERNAAIQAARQSEIARMQAEEVGRERGKDIFQNQTSADGEVTAVNVQGALPCSPDQYRRADYWDLNTNFPTLQEQAALVDPRAAKNEPSGHPGKRTLSKLQEGFVIQGDERVTGYDSIRGVLWVEGKNFQIDRRFGQATATAWADNNSLIHYRCDQQANCALTAAGEMAVLHARLNE